MRFLMRKNSRLICRFLLRNAAVLLLLPIFSFPAFSADESGGAESSPVVRHVPVFACDPELLPALRTAAQEFLRLQPGERLKIETYRPVRRSQTSSDSSADALVPDVILSSSLQHLEKNAGGENPPQGETEEEGGKKAKEKGKSPALLFCASAVLFGVSWENPVSGLSSGTALRILSGSATHWSGEEKKDRTPIHLYLSSGMLRFLSLFFSAASSSSGVTLPANPGKGEKNDDDSPSFRQERFITGRKSGAVSFAASDPDGMALLDITDFSRSELKLLPVDGVSPAMDNILSRKYPFVKLYGMTERTPLAFSDFLKTPEAARIFLCEGFFPLTLKKRTQQEGTPCPAPSETPANP